MELEHGRAFALISDVHGNLPALEAVLKELARRGGFPLVCLGDIVGYGPFPSECLALVRQNCALMVRGNHDAAAAEDGPMPYFTAAAAAAMSWTRRVLPAGERRWLGALPMTARTHGFALVHAGFSEPGAWRYTTGTAEASRSLERCREPIGFFGHTHRPAIYRLAGKRTFYEDFVGRLALGPGRLLANPGSVGQPRDGDPRAAFCLVDPAGGTIKLVRVRYDQARTVRAAAKAGLPRSLSVRLAEGT